MRKKTIIVRGNYCEDFWFNDLCKKCDKYKDCCIKEDKNGKKSNSRRHS